MRILAVLAHPDDETIFGWPIFQEPEKHELALLPACRNDHKGNGPWWALTAVCAFNGVKLYTNALLDNQFYRLPTRNDPFTLKDAIWAIDTMVQAAIQDFKPEVIFTHNPWGEYGHGDHRLVFEIVDGLRFPMLLTDICIKNECHLSHERMPSIYGYAYDRARTVQLMCELDEDWYERMKAIYEKSNAWTWGGHEPAREANLFLFGGTL